MTDEPRPEATPPPPPVTPPTTPAGPASSNRSVMIVLSYLWILALIPFLMEQDDKDVRWHAKHGLVLLGAEIAAIIAISILSGLSGGLGCLLVPLAQLGILVFHVVCIAKALEGERLLVPGLSDFADKF
ncbi:MAG: hypothetical protein VX427_06775 [Acidobacteriota bacterium]|nr:hypothetical protein [Acidobacteriota bacterium]